MTILLSLIVLMLGQQAQSKRFSDSTVGVSFSYPSGWQITEQGGDNSACAWFTTLTLGSSQIRISFTGNTFQAVAESEYFESKGGAWILGGKPARIVSGSSFRALEGERFDPRGNSLEVTLAMIERPGTCSVVFFTSSLTARKTLYEVAGSFRLNR